MTNEEKIELKRKWKNIFLRIEVIIGVIAVIFGIGLTVMVWKEGYFVGALMLVVTGIISIFLGLKELVLPSDNIFHWQSLFFMIVRRAFFFLNVVLTALVFGTMTHLPAVYFASSEQLPIWTSAHSLTLFLKNVSVWRFDPEN